jgi:hypothetical protein
MTKRLLLFVCMAGAAFAESSFELDPSETEINFALPRRCTPFMAISN